MKKTILYADDDIWYVNSVVEELEESGYEVLQVTDGTQAINVFNDKNPDLLILDIMMPTGDQIKDLYEGKRTGIKVAEHIRRELKSKTPIIYLTVINDQAVHSVLELLEKEMGLEPKILVKPIPLDDLIREIRLSLRKE